MTDIGPGEYRGSDETGPHLGRPRAVARDAADYADRFSDTVADEARWENEGGAVRSLRHREATAAS